MFALKPIFEYSQTKFALAVTIVVLLSACAQNRTKLGDERRTIPVSEFSTGGSWQEAYEPPVEHSVANRHNFRSRVKKKTLKARKSVVARGN